MKRKPPFPFSLYLFAWTFAGAIGSTVALHGDFHGHFPGFHEDDFERPDSPDIGEGWTKERGGWSLIDRRVVPDNDGIEDKILAFDNIHLDDYPWVVSVDMAGLNSARWAGVAVNIQPFSPDNYYSLIARVENPNSPGQSAIQFRRFNWGVGSVLSGHFLPEDLTLTEYFRFTVVSRQPGVFDLSVDKLDQETGEVLENLISFTVTDFEFAGGRAGLHSNAADDQVAYNRFVVNSQELTEPVSELDFHGAVEIRYAPDQGRITQLQHTSSLLDEWTQLEFPTVNLGESISRLFSARFTDREFFRVVNDL